MKAGAINSDWSYLVSEITSLCQEYGVPMTYKVIGTVGTFTLVEFDIEDSEHNEDICIGLEGAGTYPGAGDIICQGFGFELTGEIAPEKHEVQSLLITLDNDKDFSDKCAVFRNVGIVKVGTVWEYNIWSIISYDQINYGSHFEKFAHVFPGKLNLAPEHQ